MNNKYFFPISVLTLVAVFWLLAANTENLVTIKRYRTDIEDLNQEIKVSASSHNDELEWQIVQAEWVIEILKQDIYLLESNNKALKEQIKFQRWQMDGVIKTCPGREKPPGWDFGRRK